MLQFNSMDDFLQRRSIFQSIYSEIRIVEPVSKAVLFTTLEGSWTPSDTGSREPDCYRFWESGELCENCISARALTMDQTFMKIVCSNDEIYLVTAVPLLLGNQRLVLELIQNVNGNLYFNNGENVLGLTQLMLALSENVDHILVRDELTGLYNRRFIEERLPAALISACGSEAPVSLVFADIDHFKKINDQYGHVAGDLILQSVAKLFQLQVRGKDSWVARYGGDEFLICLFGVDGRAARLIAERLRKAVQQETLTLEQEAFSVTCSFGIQTVSGNTCRITAQELLSLADQKLYRAKTSGRNRTVSQ